MKTRSALASVASTIVLFIFILFCLFPIVWIILTSFKTQVEINSYPPTFISKLTIENYVSLFSVRNFPRYMLNSLLIGVLSTLLVMALATPAAYSIARYAIGGRRLAEWILSMRMLPPIAMVLPLFVMFRYVRLLHTRAAIVIVYTLMNLPFAIWILIGFFRDIPREIDESAFVDGCSSWKTMLNVVLPSAMPGLVATTILSLVFAWNEFLFALILGGGDAKTVPLAVAEYITDRAIFWGPMSAASTLAIVPILVFTLFVQKYIVRGLTLGAVK